MRNTAYVLIIATITVIALVYAQSLLIPFIFGAGFWFLTKEFRKLLNRIPFVLQYFPTWLKNVLVFTLMVMSLGFVVSILSHSINNLSAAYPQYQPNIDSIMTKIGDLFHVNVQQSIESALSNFDFGATLSSMLNGVSGILGNAFMIIIYALFIFLEESSFTLKLKKVLSKQEQYDRFYTVLKKIEVSVFDYLRLKTLVSLLTGLFSYFVLMLVGIDSPIFWAFLIFLLNYIPTIGSLVATLFPAIFSLIQFGEFTPFLIVLVAVGAVQVIVGNVIEPRIMGKTLNLSPLVTILALAIWGQIWGVVGMVLSVPITVIMVIIFSQFSSTKKVAMLLSENGDIN